MSRCIEIAKNGRSLAAPNPSVGCVIVHDGSIIGEGFTSEFGSHHAEVNAINSVKDNNQLKESSLYVTLEPCSHFGKTPPCTDLILKYEIPNIIIGTKDSNPNVGGKGIKVLKEAGRNVEYGVMESECRELHKRFLNTHEQNRPYIILKWAESKNGYIAPLKKDEKKPVWISNIYSRQLVHKWRTKEQAILVGTTTALADNPSLTSRDWYGPNSVRIVLDRHGKLPKDCSIFDDKAKTIVITSDNEYDLNGTNANISIETIEWDDKFNIAKQCCAILLKHNINSTIIEGGTKTLQTFINEGLWDEARLFKSPINIENGIKAPVIKGELMKTEAIEGDSIFYYVNNQS